MSIIYDNIIFIDDEFIRWQILPWKTFFLCMTIFRDDLIPDTDFTFCSASVVWTPDDELLLSVCLVYMIIVDDKFKRWQILPLGWHFSYAWLFSVMTWFRTPILPSVQPVWYGHQTVSCCCVFSIYDICWWQILKMANSTPWMTFFLCITIFRDDLIPDTDYTYGSANVAWTPDGELLLCV